MDTPETKIYTAIIIACLIIGAVIVAFVISFVRQQRLYVRVIRNNMLEELSLLEKDRKRIAADLHDELSPVLTAVKFQMSSLEPVDSTDAETIVISKQQIDNTIQRLREISRDMMPQVLTRDGLIPALHDFFNMIMRSKSLKIIFEHEGNLEIEEGKRINIFRIIQEVTHNTVKHSGASELFIRLKEKRNSLEVLCEDNGSGFDHQKKLAEESGLGLRNIRGRALLISDHFNVTSVIGKGTQYTFNIPLKGTYE